ncbi:hypothetical protein BSY17_2656 [Sphingobium sp. RAC03]|nr:hypothetical protein BSY17_2656 [Sphingobium sp. RAC03]
MGQLARVQPQSRAVTEYCEPPLTVALAAALDSRISVLELKVCGPESRAILQAYVDGASPPLADEEEIDTIIAGMAVALPRAKGDGAVAEAKLDIYAASLADIPLIDLRAASDHLIKTARFFPSVAEIRAAASITGRPRAARVARARVMIVRHDRDWQPPIEEMLTAEETAQLERIVATPLAGRVDQR